MIIKLIDSQSFNQLLLLKKHSKRKQSYSQTKFLIQSTENFKKNPILTYPFDNDNLTEEAPLCQLGG